MEHAAPLRQTGSPRNSNIELMRIVSMLMIIAYHAELTGFSGAAPVFPIYAWNQLLGMWGILGVNLFVITSAWFCVDQPFRIRRLIGIVFQTFVWVLTYVVLSVVYNFAQTGSLTYVLRRLFMGILEGIVQPFWVRRYWFITAYFYMMLLSPMMNRLIGTLSRPGLKKLLILLVFIPVYSNFQHSVVSDIACFCYTYLLVGYIKRHGWALLNRLANPGFILLLAAACFSARLALRLPLPPTLGQILSSGLSHTFAAKDRSSLVMLVLALLVFKCVISRPAHSSRTVNALASCCLGVYMFHENHIMEFPNVTNRFFHYLTETGFIRFSALYPLQYLAAVLALFAAGTVLEALRRQLIQKPFMHLLDRFNEKLSRIDDWFSEVLTAI